MRCRRCKEKAVIHLPSHHLALCKTCFSPWVVQQVRKTIKKFKLFRPEEPVLIAVSGGKDSLALWHILDTLGYETAGLHIHLGIQGDGYSDRSLEACQAMAERLKKPLFIEEVTRRIGASVDEIEKTSPRPACSACGLVKRYLMNRVALDQGFPVVATGHNLDDEVATLFSNNLRWDFGYFGRQYPLLEARDGFARKVKPMVTLSEKENALYCILNGITYIRQECPYAINTLSIPIKEALNRLEHRSPGIKRLYLSEFYKHQPFFASLQREKELAELQKCQACGQPTTRPICTFCSLKAHFQKKGDEHLGTSL